MTHTTNRPGRTGFTLIELLVVIAIIAVLVSLTAAALFKILGKGPETQARSDIDQLANAINTMKSEFHVSFIPSTITLREDNNYNSANVAHRQTVAFLQQMFGKNISLKTSTPIDWNGDGTISTADIVLQGQDCLVFFLGGIPSQAGSSNSCLGFSRDPKNPATLGGARYGPYFPFQSKRLVASGTAAGFLNYVDPWLQQPIAYFSSRKGKDYTADCPALGVSFYSDLAGNMFNPNGFQIITAGADGAFGTATTWDPQNGAPSGPHADNMTNFTKGQLKAAQN